MRLILWVISVMVNAIWLFTAWLFGLWAIECQYSSLLCFVGKGEQELDAQQTDRACACACSVARAHLFTYTNWKIRRRRRRSRQKKIERNTKQTGQIAYVLQCVGIKHTLQNITFYEITMIWFTRNEQKWYLTIYWRKKNHLLTQKRQIQMLKHTYFHWEMKGCRSVIHLKSLSQLFCDMRKKNPITHTRSNAD